MAAGSRAQLAEQAGVRAARVLAVWASEVSSSYITSTSASRSTVGSAEPKDRLYAGTCTLGALWGLHASQQPVRAQPGPLTCVVHQVVHASTTKGSISLAHSFRQLLVAACQVKGQHKHVLWGCAARLSDALELGFAPATGHEVQGVVSKLLGT